MAYMIRVYIPNRAEILCKCEMRKCGKFRIPTHLNHENNYS